MADAPLVTLPLRLLVAESETAEARDRRRASTGRSSGESYIALLETLMPRATCELVRPVEAGPDSEPREALGAYDAVFLTGSPLHVYKASPAVRRQLAFMRAVFASRTPGFGSCAGLQVAVAAAGGSVRENRNGHEVGIARRILRSQDGRTHPLLDGRPDVFDAPAIHSDEVDTLPSEGATLLAGNRVTRVQAAEIRFDGGVFWGVQYHPELPLEEIADAMRRQADDIVEQGLAASGADVESQAALIQALGEQPDRQDLAWRLGVDREITVPFRRQAELRNFVLGLVCPLRQARGRQ